MLTTTNLTILLQVENDEALSEHIELSELIPSWLVQAGR
jgi:hypothetical protein